CKKRQESADQRGDNDRSVEGAGVQGRQGIEGYGQQLGQELWGMYFMRIDKYLKVSRLIKRRTLANEACETGHVTINGRIAKPGTDVKPGDIIEIRFGSNLTRVRVLSTEEHVTKEGAKEMYTIL